MLKQNKQLEEEGTDMKSQIEQLSEDVVAKEVLANALFVAGFLLLIATYTFSKLFYAFYWT